MVFPGFDDVMARRPLLVSEFIRLLLPTLLRPIKANSGKLVCGHWLSDELLDKNEAVLIFIGIGSLKYYIWFALFYVRFILFHIRFGLFRVRLAFSRIFSTRIDTPGIIIGTEKLLEVCKVSLKQNASTVRGQRRFGEVAVICLTIGLETDGTRSIEQPTDIEVTYKIVGIGSLITITEIAIYE